MQNCQLSDQEATSFLSTIRGHTFFSCGRFNIRLFIRALSEILEKSLAWERNHVELTQELLNLQWVKDTITDVLVSEILKEKENIYVTEKEFLKSIAAAEIAEKILLRGSSDKISLERLKISISKKFNAPIPTNIEIIASVNNPYYRRRV